MISCYASGQSYISVNFPLASVEMGLSGALVKAADCSFVVADEAAQPFEALLVVLLELFQARILRLVLRIVVTHALSASRSMPIASERDGVLAPVGAKGLSLRYFDLMPSFSQRRSQDCHGQETLNHLNICPRVLGNQAGNEGTAAGHGRGRRS